MPGVSMRIQFHHGVREKTGEAGVGGLAANTQTLSCITRPLVLSQPVLTPPLVRPSKPISGIVELIIAADCSESVRTMRRVQKLRLIPLRDAVCPPWSRGQVRRVRVKHAARVPRAQERRALLGRAGMTILSS